MGDCFAQEKRKETSGYSGGRHDRNRREMSTRRLWVCNMTCLPQVHDIMSIQVHKYSLYLLCIPVKG